MALESIALPAATRRRLTLDALHGLAQGDLAERLRLDAAARVLATTRQVAGLVAAGDLPGAAPLPAAAQGWDATTTTAREYAETLAPAALDTLLAEAPRWAQSVLAVPQQRRAA